MGWVFDIPAPPTVRQKRARKRRARERARLKRRMADLLAVFGGTCAYCERRPAVTRDHAVPRSAGGRDTAENLLPACRRCNLRKGNTPFLEWLEHCGGELWDIAIRVTGSSFAEQRAVALIRERARRLRGLAIGHGDRGRPQM